MLMMNDKRLQITSSVNRYGYLIESLGAVAVSKINIKSCHFRGKSI
jgi:hypothetical protein